MESDSAVALGTLVLAIFTGVLAWQTRQLARQTADAVSAANRTAASAEQQVRAAWAQVALIQKQVDELRAARATPFLVASFGRFTYGYGRASITNVGSGPAISLSVRVIYQPRHESALAQEERLLELPLLGPGEHLFVDVPKHGEQPMDYEHFLNGYGAIRLEGTMSNINQEPLEVSHIHKLMSYDEWARGGIEEVQEAPLERIAEILKRILDKR